MQGSNTNRGCPKYKFGSPEFGIVHIELMHGDKKIESKSPTKQFSGEPCHMNEILVHLNTFI